MILPDNKKLLDELIIGRVQPHIYAFYTNTIPNYLKVGDTYRTVGARLQEWKKIFPNLEKKYECSASINSEVFFRDYSVHQYLENDLSKKRLLPQEYPDIYYSNEFFQNVHIENIQEAIKDIQDNYENNTGKYKYYDANNQLPKEYHYASTEEWPIRPNQEATIRNFVAAVNAGHTKLLMYAVMRFGKSFTSLCCAKEIDAKIVLVVSAKGDVCDEWQKTVESPENFNKDYVFISSKKLLNDKSIITTTLNNGKKVVVFLTLQDLQGEYIKDKHQEIFGQQIDLLIVDETHYGARAESYGSVIRSANYEKDVKEKYANEDFIEINDAEKQLKSLSVKITLHLSGTPYRILMGSEFSKEEIIAFYQFSDIVRDQKKWDEEHLLNDAEDVKEWDNPYYGFPQMIRFAFVPSKSALAVLESLRSSGTTYAFSALLKPQSISKDSKHSLHKKFVYEKEVLELFKAIDGTKDDDGLLSFLDYDKIKSGNMCQHIVCVLPYCASCDALEALINNNRETFKNLKDYTIINISGVDTSNEYSSVRAVKAKIEKCALAGIKTLTLTVNRMLTGSTVKEWDTMIFLKDTASPQEYDQAIFRLQNQYIREYVENDGDIIKFNMKPQTLLVDFDPHRMFVMQEQKSQIYNANIDAAGNKHLRDRLEEELRISPIITINKNRIEQVEATDILTEISEYSSSRGVIDETRDIPIDMSLLDIDIIKTEIEIQAELGSRQGLSVDAHKGKENDMDNPDEDEDSTDGGGQGNTQDDVGGKKDSSNNSEKEDIKSLENKFRTYYSRILFFAYLTESYVSSLDEIIQCLLIGDNARIAKNLCLDINVLSAIRKHMYFSILSKLDYKIQNINTLSHDESIDPMQKVAVAIRKFGRISDSEITTPEIVASSIIDLIPDKCFVDLTDKDTRILDIASKMGEFAVAIVKRCNILGISISDIKNKVLSIATSSIAYEFTRKVYEYLGLDTACIAQEFNTYELLTINCKQQKVKEKNDIDYALISQILSQAKEFNTISLNKKELEVNTLKFNAVVGNPPYQEKAKGTSSSDDPIFHYFMDMAYAISDRVALITPARFLSNAGKTPKSWNKKMLNDSHLSVPIFEKESNNLFAGVQIPGGLAVTYRDLEQDFGPIGIFTPYKELIEIEKKVKRKTDSSLSNIMYVQSKFNLEALYEDYPELKERMSGNGKDKRFRQIVLERFPEIFTKEANSEKSLRILGKIGSERTYRFIKRKYVLEETWTDKYKVFIPFSNGASGTLGNEPARLISKPVVGYPLDGITQTFIGAGAFDTEEEAINLNKYIHSKFARIMLGILKVTQGNKIETWEKVPLLDFSSHSFINWNTDISAIDQQLYSYFKLSDKEITFIESHIANLDF